MNSPIDHLTAVLQTIRDSARTFAPQLKGSEAATRAALVDPVLRALGWDVANPSRVLVEKTQTVQGKSLKVDYALLHGAEIKIIVEAKKLGGNLQTDFLQLVNYSFGLNVGSIWVSDGVIWRHYQDISYSNTNPTKEFDLSHDKLPMVAAYFVQQMDATLISPVTPKLDELNDRIEVLEGLVSQLKKQLDAKVKVKSEKASNSPAKEEKKTVESGENWYEVGTQKKVFSKTAVGAMVGALRALADSSPQVLPEIEKEMELQLTKRKVKVIKRRWIARSKEALYDDPRFWNNSEEIAPGWWIGTHYSNNDKREMLQTAAKIANRLGIEFEFFMV